MIDDPGLASEISRLTASRCLPPAPPPPIYSAPTTSVASASCHYFPSGQSQIEAVQSFIESFDYNYSGKPFFKLVKSKGSKHVFASANSLIEAALPIQCVEAVFIALLLTSSFKNLIRIPVSFKSRHKGNSHKHIVLAIYDKSSQRWGSLGLSRRSCLMYKSLTFNSLGDLINEFRRSYESCFHRLTKLYLGDPIVHDMNKVDRSINWKAETIRISPSMDSGSSSSSSSRGGVGDGIASLEDSRIFDIRITAYLDSRGLLESMPNSGK